MVKTSDDARDLLRDFCESHSVSMSAFLQAIARHLPSPGQLAPRLPPLGEIVEEARAIDTDGRRRG